MQPLGDDEAEDAIAEKLEPLEGTGSGSAGMGQGAPQERRVGETVAKALFQISR
jgi:hypothetical protein